MKKSTFGSLVASAVSSVVLSSTLMAQGAAPAAGAADAGKAAAPAADAAKASDHAADAKGPYCQNNSCKGKSACAGHGNANGCAGKNECKGHGFLEAKDGKACKKAGGKWMKG